MSGGPEKLIPGRDLVQCGICARRFSSDRVKIHEAICQKSFGITRKSFDPSQQRIRGTEVEKLLKAVPITDVFPTSQDRPPALSTNWRWKHEDFINKITVAKGDDKSQKSGDTAQCLPVDCEDFIHCPHCFRKLNHATAERHISTCARMSKT